MTIQQNLSDATTAAQNLTDQGATVTHVAVDPDGYTVTIAEDPDDFDTSGIGGGVIKGNDDD